MQTNSFPIKNQMNVQINNNSNDSQNEAIEKFLEFKRIHNGLLPELNRIVEGYLYSSKSFLKSEQWKDFIVFEDLNNRNIANWDLSKISAAFTNAFESDDFDLASILIRVSQIKKINLNTNPIILINQVNSQNLFHQATLFNRLSFLKALLESNLIDVNVKTLSQEKYEDQTALHIAASNLNIKALNLLLNTPNIDISIKDAAGFNPFDRVLMQDDKKLQMEAIEIFKTALSNNLTNICDGRILLTACYSEFEDFALNLINSGYIKNINFQIESYGYTPLFASIKKNLNSLVIEALINHPKINVNKRCSYFYSKITPLHLAVISNNLNAIKLLISHPRIKIDKEEECQHKYRRIDATPLFTAVRLNNIEAVSLLLTKSSQFKSSYYWRDKTYLKDEMEKFNFMTCFEMAKKNKNNAILNLLNEAYEKQQSQQNQCSIQ